jgi:hypothetical protein
MIEPGGTSRYTPKVEQRLLHGLVTALQPNEVTQRGDVDAVDGATVPNGDEVQVGDLPATYMQIDPSQDTSHALRVHHTWLFLDLKSYSIYTAIVQLYRYHNVKMGFYRKGDLPEIPARRAWGAPQATHLAARCRPTPWRRT